jgi:D-3-phosphoglycerate dehydrogenase
VHVLGIRSKTRVTERALGEARRLLTVGAFCIGTSQVFSMIFGAAIWM